VPRSKASCYKGGQRRSPGESHIPETKQPKVRTTVMRYTEHGIPDMSRTELLASVSPCISLEKSLSGLASAPVCKQIAPPWAMSAAPSSPQDVFA
jgi:hypothetical protein